MLRLPQTTRRTLATASDNLADGRTGGVPSYWMFNPEQAEEQYGGSYLQAGGIAEKMSVELRRREDDGEYRFSIVGRDHDLAEPLTETIDVQAAHEPRHPSELFTADQAAPVFMH